MFSVKQFLPVVDLGLVEEIMYCCNFHAEVIFGLTVLLYFRRVSGFSVSDIVLVLAL